MEVRWESDCIRGLVPKPTASFLVGFRTRPCIVDEPAVKRRDTPLKAAEIARYRLRERQIKNCVSSAHCC